MLLGNKFKSAGLPQSRSEVYMGSDGNSMCCDVCLMLLVMLGDADDAR